MKSPVPPFIEAVRELTSAGLETLAAEVLGLDAVRGRIVAAAKDGYRVVLIRPSRPVDLRPTAAAMAAEKHLADSGFKTSWEGYVVEIEAHRFTGFEMRITWSD